MIKLFVVGFPLDTNEQSLREMFTPFGEIEWVKIIKDSETSKSRGYGFVAFREEAAAKRAFEAMDLKIIDGRTLSVKIATNKLKQSPIAETHKGIQRQGISKPNPLRQKRPRIVK